MARHKTSIVLTALLMGLLTMVAPAQIIPQSAHVNLYFPHFAVGGPPPTQWQTTFLFSNPSVTSVATVQLATFGDNGQPVQLDFGSGPNSTFSFTIPPQGSRILRSVITSEDAILVGWAQAASSIPVQGNLEFRTVVNGVPRLAVGLETTLPSFRYLYPANFFTGFALASIATNRSASVLVSVANSEGGLVGQVTETVPPNGHVAFTLRDRFPNLGAGFEGIVTLSSMSLSADFVALALRSTAEGVISSLPSGRFGSPRSHWDEIWLAFLTTLDVAQRVFPQVFVEGGPIELQIGTESEINALARNGNVVRINLALAELISDSPSELAFAIAHELGHIYQQRTGRLEIFPDNPEQDADVLGLFISLGAGYDPYAAAGVLSKLAMATGSADLVSQQFFEALLVIDAHGSFNERVSSVFDVISLACTLMRDDCEFLKSVLHPHFPQSAPLLRMPDPERTRPGQDE